MSDLAEIFGPVIHSYSRADAIRDGTLVEVDASTAREAGWRWPVALTRRAHAECVAMTPAAKRAGCDERGRLWDILWMASCAVRRAPAGGDRLAFTVYVVQARTRPTPVRLELIVGPGDTPEPVVTIGLPGED